MHKSTLKIIISVLGCIGVYSTWGRTIIDGTLARLITALHSSTPYLMPGTQVPLNKCITGIYWPIDYLLNILILFFYEAVDGSHPTTSIVALYFAGQHLSTVTIMYVDSYRHGHTGRWGLGATLWLMLFQLTAIGTSGPWFLAFYFHLSPLVQTSLVPSRFRSSHLANPTHILILPVSVTLGYAVPVILMALRSPSVVSSDFKQLAIAIWNGFPLTMWTMQTILFKSLSFLDRGQVRRKSTNAFPAVEFLQAARVCYGFAFVLSCACHIGVSVVCASTILFPMIFNPEYAHLFWPGKLLVPPISWAAVSTFGEADLGYMQWDQVIGYACMLLYAGVTYVRTQDRLGQSRSWKLYGALFVGWLVSGPGSTALACSWAKDEMLFASGEECETETKEENAS